MRGRPVPKKLLREEAQSDWLQLEGLRVVPGVTPCAATGQFTSWTAVEQYPKLEACPVCGCRDKQFKRNGTRTQLIRDVPRGLQTTYLNVLRQSYYCYQCRSATQHPLTAVTDKWRMTARLVDYIQQLALLRPAREVALLTGTSVGTVRDIFAEYRRRLRETVEFETPRVLGLDGVYAKVGGKGKKRVRRSGKKRVRKNGGKRVKKKGPKRLKHQCAIYTDLERGLVIDLQPSATRDSVAEVLSKLPNKKSIQVIVIDMSRPLFSAVRKALPHAAVVIDVYHIQSLINVGLDNVRKRLRAGATRKKGQSVMCSKELLRKRRSQLTEQERKELERWFEIKPELKVAYEVAEKCLEIWFSSSSRTARKRYQIWLSKFPREMRDDFAELLSAFSKWVEQICNYLDFRFTNAFTESRNRIVKDVLRETRGCDFDTLHDRVIYGALLRKKLENARREEIILKKQGLPVITPTQYEGEPQEIVSTKEETFRGTKRPSINLAASLQLDLFASQCSQ